MAAAFTHGTAPSSREGLHRVCLTDVARRVNEILLGAVLLARVTRRALRGGIGGLMSADKAAQ